VAPSAERGLDVLGQASQQWRVEQARAIVQTRIMRCARSRAATRVMPTMPALAEAYGIWPICPS
jgi:hypothetical protein